MVFSNTLIVSLKTVFISTGVLTIAILLKMSVVPFVVDFAVGQAPVLWSSFQSWLKPPYLYVIINGIIITIVASSKFYHHNDDDVSESKPEEISVLSQQQQTDVVDYEVKLKSDFGDAAVVYHERVVVEAEKEIDMPPPVVFEEMAVAASGLMEIGYGDDVAVGDTSTTTTLERQDSSEVFADLTAEKPLVSSRFGHRKPLKSTPEGGRALRRVTKPKRHDTLEHTWKAITEGRSIPLNRHLKKSDTMTENHHHGRQMMVHVDDPMKKSETFKDRTNCQLNNNNSPPVSSTGKLRKEPSLSQDELNRRVEAFIKKFNDEMRLQRQESLNQYKEMVGRGVTGV